MKTKAYATDRIAGTRFVSLGRNARLSQAWGCLLCGQALGTSHGERDAARTRKDRE
jgi:hypothetical protein